MYNGATFCADCQEMAVFLIFQDGDHIPSWIVKSWKC